MHELMKPRIKCIKDFYAYKKIGNKGFVFEPQGKAQSVLPVIYPDHFIFLEWHDDRKKEEMPDYIKYIGNDYEDEQQVIYLKEMGGEHKFFDDGSYFGINWESGGGLICTCFLPATEQEYFFELKRLGRLEK